MKIDFEFVFAILIIVVPIILVINQGISRDKKKYEEDMREKGYARKTHYNLIVAIKRVLIGLLALGAVFAAIYGLTSIGYNKREKERTHFRQAIEQSDRFSWAYYDSEEAALYLTYRESEHEYKYADIPWKLYQDFYHCDDIDEFYEENIKGKYPVMRVD